MRVHEDEVEVPQALVQALVADQFPQWRDLPLERVEPHGTVNVIYRLGDELAVRLPRVAWAAEEDDQDREETWLPRLAPHLPVEIPLPVGRGAPGHGYPWRWAIVTWVTGEVPTSAIAARELGGFVTALRRIDAASAPAPAGGRGRPLHLRDEHVRDALQRVEAPAALELWTRAMSAPEWRGPRVWLHADLDRRNVIVRDGRLRGVIDWGGMGAGDPAVDVMAAWKLVAAHERSAFREVVEADDATWLRAQGWVLSQALIALGYYTPETNPALHAEATRWLAEVLPS